MTKIVLWIDAKAISIDDDDAESAATSFTNIEKKLKLHWTTSRARPTTTSLIYLSLNSILLMVSPSTQRLK